MMNPLERSVASLYIRRTFPMIDTIGFDQRQDNAFHDVARIRYQAPVAMESIDTTRLIEFHDELLVEVQGSDDRGDLSVITYQFAYGNEQGAVQAKQPIDDAHREAVETALKEEGFRLRESLDDQGHAGG